MCCAIASICSIGDAFPFQETLDAMRKTAFASASVLAENEDIKKEDISLMSKVNPAILLFPIKFAIQELRLLARVVNSATSVWSRVTAEYLSSFDVHFGRRNPTISRLCAAVHVLIQEGTC